MSNGIDVLNKAPSHNQIDVPFERVPLPSKGLLYPEEHPLHNQEYIEIKAMTATEEDILTSRALIKKGAVVDTLISACIMNKTVSPSTLLLGDKNAILIGIRIGGFGQEYEIKTTCPEESCGKSYNHTFDLSALELKGIGANPTSPGSNSFEFKLPKSGETVVFKLLTAGDDADLTAAQEAKKKMQKKNNFTEIETNVTDKLIHSILSYGGEKDRSTIATKVRRMNAGDSKKLLRYMNEISPDVKMVQEVKCPHCDAVEKHDVVLGTEFFWPK